MTAQVPILSVSLRDKIFRTGTSRGRHSASFSKFKGKIWKIVLNILNFGDTLCRFHYYVDAQDCIDCTMKAASGRSCALLPVSPNNSGRIYLGLFRSHLLREESSRGSSPPERKTFTERNPGVPLDRYDFGTLLYRSCYGFGTYFTVYAFADVQVLFVKENSYSFVLQERLFLLGSCGFTA